MAERELISDALPAAYRDGFQQFARTLLELAGDNLRGLSAFGGWLVHDTFFEGTPARSVAVLQRIDLKMLGQLASAGVRFGKQNVSAPLMMTPEYIKASCDVFPLELLEIQQLHAVVYGEGHFADLEFDRNDVRLQCERELKSELIQLRQGLLAAAGRHKLLGELCLTVIERTVRILRGLLFLADPSKTLKPAADVVQQAAAHTDVGLNTLDRLVGRPPEIGMPEFERLYDEIAHLATYADTLQNSTGGRS